MRVQDEGRGTFHTPPLMSVEGRYMYWAGSAGGGGLVACAVIGGTQNVRGELIARYLSC